MISGAHVILYSADPEADRAFIRDVLGFDSVDAGDDWLIFALPPAEVAVHPAKEGQSHELYLTCRDLDATVAELKRKGANVAPHLYDERWGRLVHMDLPGGGRLGIYQPKHPLAHDAPLTQA